MAVKLALTIKSNTDLYLPGTVPTTELLRHAGKLQQVYSIFCVDRVLRPCLSSSKKVHEAAMQIAELATSDKYEGVFHPIGVVLLWLKKKKIVNCEIRAKSLVMTMPLGVPVG